jgi:hypothetical protein
MSRASPQDDGESERRTADQLADALADILGSKSQRTERGSLRCEQLESPRITSNAKMTVLMHFCE